MFLPTNCTENANTPSPEAEQQTLKTTLLYPLENSSSVNPRSFGHSSSCSACITLVSRDYQTFDRLICSTFLITFKHQSFCLHSLRVIESVNIIILKYFKEDSLKNKLKKYIKQTKNRILQYVYFSTVAKQTKILLKKVYFAVNVKIFFYRIGNN